MTVGTGDLMEQRATEQVVEVQEAGVLPADDVLELQRTTARTARLKAAKDELRAAFEIAQVLTNSTSINPEFQAHAERTKKRKVNGQWKVETLPPLGEQAIYNLAVAIIYGDKLGWSPEESAMRVFSVHGKPSIEAKDAVAFITAFIELRLADGRTVPFLEGGDWIWPVEESDAKAVWKSRRNGVEVTSEWTIQRAQQAQYTENAKYQTNPQEMLRWKAAMEVARIQWMDVLRGIAYSREELELEAAPTVSVVSHRPATNRKGVGGLEQLLAERKQQQQSIPAATVVDPVRQERRPEPVAADAPPAASPQEPPAAVSSDSSGELVNSQGEIPASKDQLTKVRDALKVERFNDPHAQEALEFMSSIVTRPLTQFADLSESEAGEIVQVMTK